MLKLRKHICTRLQCKQSVHIVNLKYILVNPTPPTPGEIKCAACFFIFCFSFFVIIHNTFYVLASLLNLHVPILLFLVSGTLCLHNMHGHTDEILPPK